MTYTVYFNNEIIKAGFDTMKAALDFIEVLTNTVFKTTGQYPKNGRFHI